MSQKMVMISTRERGLDGAVARWQVGVIRRRVTILRQQFLVEFAHHSRQLKT